MNITHVLNCRKGGLIKHGHTQHRYQCSAMAQMTGKNVHTEPIMKEADQSNNSPALQF